MTEGLAWKALDEVLAIGGLPPADRGTVSITGHDPVYRTRFRMGELAAGTLAATGVAVSELWRERTGRGQRVSVDTRVAAASLRSNVYLRRDGAKVREVMGGVSGTYPASDGRHVFLHCNFPHLRDGMLRLIGAEETRESVAAAVTRWEGQKLEDAIAEAGVCGGMVRSRDEWWAHPQGKAVAALPLFEMIRIGDAPPEPLPGGDVGRPLAGIRALDLTRVLAGPTCGRTLAEHGAHVMRVAGPHLPFLEALVMDTGHGKLSAHVDLRDAVDRARFDDLVRASDVFVQAYRPGTLAERGLSPEALAARRPGIVYVSLSAYGHEGPWLQRRGFDSIVQTVSGIAHENGDGAAKHLPGQALDYISGYLMAFGALAGLLRRAREGGSWFVRVSLAQTGRWLDSTERLPAAAIDGLPEDISAEELASRSMDSDTPFGRLTHLKPVVGLSETPPFWSRPAVPLGTHPPVWPA